MEFSGHSQLTMDARLLMTETIRHSTPSGTLPHDGRLGNEALRAARSPADWPVNGDGGNGSGVVFKPATEAWEFDEIFQLNYASFVEEVPQHPGNDERALVDRFHAENTYFICRRERELLGMICVRDRRPFSLDQKLGRLEDYLPQAEGARLCEVRLLAVRPDLRRTRVLPGLLTMMARYCQEGGYDYVVMSGRVSQQQLYRRIGFIPFGPVVGGDDAPYQPMYRPVGNVAVEFARQVPRGGCRTVRRAGDTDSRPRSDAGGRAASVSASAAFPPSAGVPAADARCAAGFAPAHRRQSLRHNGRLRHDGQRRGGGAVVAAQRGRASS